MAANSNNGYRFWRTCLSILTISFLLISCADDESAGDESVINYREAARGLWEAISGDIKISSGPGIVVYNWYGIDTTAHIDTMAVTWDDGMLCPTIIVEMSSDEIFIVVGSVEGTFKIHDDESATVTFHWDEGSFVKNLEKIRDDPQVFCD